MLNSSGSGILTPHAAFSSGRGGEAFPSPWMDMATQSMPQQNKNALEWCLPSGVLLELPGGQLQAIEEVPLESRVLTRGGTYERVVHRSSRVYAGNMVQLTYAGFGKQMPFLMTPEHKVYRISTPNMKPSRLRLDASKAVRVESSQVQPGDYVATPLIPGSATVVPRFDGYLFGAYLAEGCPVETSAGISGTRFSLSDADEELGYIAKLQDLILRGCDLRVETTTPGSRPEVRLLTAYDIELTDWCVQMGGRNATAKRLHAEVFAWSREEILNALAGWIDGDGWISRGGLKGHTSSRQLMFQLVRLANMAGLAPTVCRRPADDRPNVRAKHQIYQKVDGYHISFDMFDSQAIALYSLKVQNAGGLQKPKGGKFRSCFVQDGYVFRRVVTATLVPYKGLVHNLEVENDHSYIADGVLTSNCEYVFNSCGTYRMAQERMISYFLTDLDITSADKRKPLGDDEKDQWTNLLEETLSYKEGLQALTRDEACFHGDVCAVTKRGVFPLRVLAGKTEEVLSKDGIYRPAEFKCFGKQELWEVEFSDGRKILATGNHEWVGFNCSDKYVRVPTIALRRGYRIPRTVAPRPDRNDEFYEGVRHGFVFGDGFLYNEGYQAAAQFFGAKDAAMLRFFENVNHCEPCVQAARPECTVLRGWPPEYKYLPEHTASANYWYGFVCGFLAADGSADTHGCCVLTQAAKATLDAIAVQLPRIGMCGGPIRGHWRTSTIRQRNGKVNTYRSKMHYLTLLKRFVLPQDFLIPSHRRKFMAKQRATPYGQCVSVKAVRRTGTRDLVYCCVEPETHTFVVDQGILTGNCYGNGFMSLVVPFKRFLRSPFSGFEYSFREMANNRGTFNLEYDANKCEFTAVCPQTNKRGTWKIDDRPDDLERKLRLKLWSPHAIEIVPDPWTGQCDYLWKVEEDYKKEIRRGNMFQLERAPTEVLKAVRDNGWFLFEPDALFHLKQPVISGVRTRGWGLSRTLVNFRDIWYVQVLRRYNEAIALDYIMPFRLITPAPRPGGGGGGGLGTDDPLRIANMGDMRGQLNAMLRRRRKDLTAWHTLPFPVEYQSLGGEATQMAPTELIEQAYDTLLNATGTPTDMYRGSLQIQTAPVACRLFEATHIGIPSGNNRALRWIVNQVSQLLNLPIVQVGMRRVTHADDFNLQMAALQLFMGQQLSGSSALSGLGFDWKDEQRRIAEEASYQQRLQAELQEEMQQSAFGESIAKGQQGGQQGGAPAPGGQPGGQQGGQPQQVDPATGQPMAQPVSSFLAGPNVSTTPQDMLAQADSLAQQLLGLPESQKDSELRQLKSKNEAMHALVTQKIKSRRQQAQTAGGAMLLGQNAASPQAM